MQIPSLAGCSSGDPRAGHRFAVQIVATGGRTIPSVTLYYRSLGEGKFILLPMTRGFGNVYQASIPTSVVTERGLEYYIEVNSMDGQLIRVPKGLPSIAVTVVKTESFHSTQETLP